MRGDVTWFVALAFVAGCYTAPDHDDEGERTAPQHTHAHAESTTSSASSPASDDRLPREIQELLVARCQRCHSATDGPMPLGTFEDLIAPAKSDPSRRVADLCIERLRDSRAPMPPSGPRVPDATILAFESWARATLLGPE
jgi:mono/diheme cytochrome c family protein